ncbi:hypothetical protein QEN19_001606 [Hanseniaspora menglaensis]
MVSSDNINEESQPMATSQSHSNGNRFRKSIASRHFSTTSTNDTLVDEESNSITSESNSSTSKKRPSGISMLKKKLSNATHSSHYHSPLHMTKIESLPEPKSIDMSRQASDISIPPPSNNPLSKIFSNKEGNNSVYKSSEIDSELERSQSPNNGFPLNRSFSTSSFFSNKFKRNSKDDGTKNMENLSPMNSNELITGYAETPLNDSLFAPKKISHTDKSQNNKNKKYSVDIVTGMDKLMAYSIPSEDPASVDLTKNNYFLNAPVNTDFSIIADIREPSNLEVPFGDSSQKNAWKAPESWDVFNSSDRKDNISKESSDDFLSISNKKNDYKILDSSLKQAGLANKSHSDTNIFGSLKDKKLSLVSTNSDSMSPLSKALEKSDDKSLDLNAYSQKTEHIMEERDDSYDSDNDDIILTKKSLLKTQSAYPHSRNELLDSGNQASTLSSGKNSSSIDDAPILDEQKNASQVSATSFKTHSESVVSVPKELDAFTKPRRSLPNDTLESAPIALNPYINEKSNVKILTDSRINSYELYYNDFSTFDMNKKYVIKIVNLETNTFTTLSCVLNATVSEMIPLLKKKFNCPLSGNFQISLKIGKLSKVLHPKAKPVSIQLRLLLLSGYRKTHDPLTILGIEDLSFVFQFLFHPVITSQLSREKEELILKRGDFIHADLRDMDLSRPPIIFYQRANEIESLDLSSNANSFLPLDFIEAATSLTSIRMVNLRASKFPQNITNVATLVSLELSRNFIKRIPDSISSLKNLTILNLQCNKLYDLPQSFSKLQHLQLLDLSSNHFTIYPEVINYCLNLLQIDLSSNRIESLPNSINNLTKLAKLNLSSNNFESIQNLSSMTNLRTINLKDNQISFFSASSKTLQYIYLSGNKISSFADFLPNLRTLELEKNPLTSVYFKENYMNYLTTLTLSKANLTIVPSIIWKKFIKLKKLDLNENNLTQISEAIGNLTELTYLSCNRNKLEKIPKSIVNLKNLKILDLHSNNITEMITGFVKLELTTLNLSSNSLNPWQNNLTTELTEDSPLAKSLTILALADNRLNNESTVWLKMFLKLKYLNLSYNFFTDFQLRHATSLLELYLSGNQLAAIPGESIASMTSLQVLMINSNKIHTLPAELSFLKHLTVLDCSNNLLKYNISNFEYDYNWLPNKELRYLNFSGNKRFEIADSVIHNINYADLTKLERLLVLSLMDVTLKTSKIPDEDYNLRLRTTESRVNNMAYGVADYLGSRSFVNYRDNAVQRFRGKIDESLLMLTDGKNEISNTTNKLPKILRDIYPSILTRMLEKYGDDSEKAIKNALRHSFLQLNKELNSKVHSSNGININQKGTNSYMNAPTASGFDNKLSFVDLSSGATLTVVYIKEKIIYTANIGDTMAVLSRSTGDHIVMTKKHIPTNPQEYARIRIAGGYVNNDKVDGVTNVSRSVGFFHLLPHIHASPDINVMELTKTDDMLIIATNELWNYIDYETASDIARVNKKQPMNASAQIRDFAIAYGCKDSVCVICVSFEGSSDSLQEFSGQFNINRDALVNMRRSNAFEDSVLRRLEPEIPPPTGNISIVFTDIKNSTSLWESYPDAMRSAIKTHNNVMRRNLRLFGGYEVKTEGDAFMVAFPTPLAALNWCLTVQLKLLQATWPEQITKSSDGCLVSNEHNDVLFLGLSVRMGIHWGKPVPEMDVVTQRMDYLGPVVNKAARVSSVADGGQITLSMDFITEFKAILDMSRRYSNKEGDLKQVYGDEFVGEVLERQLQTLKDIGYSLHDLGETKMKGLEAKEFITLVYPEKIKGRFSLIQSQNDDLLKSRETLFFLRNITLKLEDVVTYYDCDKSTFFDQKEAGKMFNFTSDTRAAIVGTGGEKDMIKFFIHLITRLESLIATLNIRQKMYGHLERLDEDISIFEILDTLTAMENNPKKTFLTRKPD